MTGVNPLCDTVQTKAGCVRRVVAFVLLLEPLHALVICGSLWDHVFRTTGHPPAP